MNLRRVARAALVGPIMITGGMLVLTLGSANVFAASATGEIKGDTSTLEDLTILAKLKASGE